MRQSRLERIGRAFAAVGCATLLVLTALLLVALPVGAVWLIVVSLKSVVSR